MHRHRSSIAIALAAVALAAPAAQARPIDPPIGTFTEEEQRALRGESAVPAPEPVPSTTAPRVQSTASGFDWGSAAVGASGGILVLLTVGGLSVGGRRRLRTSRG